LRSQLIGVVVISGRVSDHLLALGADPLDFGAEVADRCLPAAREDIEIERHCLDARIGGGDAQGVDHSASRYSRGGAAAGQGEGIDLRGLLDDRAVDAERERAARRAAGVGRGDRIA
jgi:hypothetical protein